MEQSYKSEVFEKCVLKETSLMVFLPDVQYCALFLGIWSKGISWNMQGMNCVCVQIIDIDIDILSINTPTHYSQSRLKVYKLLAEKYPKIKFCVFAELRGDCWKWENTGKIQERTVLE